MSALKIYTLPACSGFTVVGKIMRGTRFLRSVLFILALFQARNSPAQIPSQEYQIKGAFVFNFAKFTTWPESSYAYADSPFVIGIVGNDPFGNFLPALVAGETIQGHPIEIEYYSTPEQIKNCHILFIEQAMAPHIEQIVKNLDGHKTLTISDTSDFTKKGGVAMFYIENKKMRFQVNIGKARQADFTMSSKLLRLADICCDI